MPDIGERGGQISFFREKLRGGGDAPELAIAPVGSFLMGAPEDDKDGSRLERPLTEIIIRRPFCIGRHPVTFDEYDHFADQTGRARPDDYGFGRGDLPVINISWIDAAAYCRFLCDETGARYRLPSEAEWEYVCRAGSDAPYSTGLDITTDAANFDPSDESDPIGFRGRTTPKGAFAPNAWGVFDMHGNVSEWCADRWAESHADADRYGAPRPIDLDEFLNTVVVRGGGWSTKKKFLRASERYHYEPSSAFEMIGFRVVRDL